ncbi:hypothetical protein GCM10009000_082010 [Halobacterium noricense]
MGRNGGLEAGFFETLGIEYLERSGQEWKTAWDAVREHIEEGVPVMLFVDLYYLDYFDTNTHFGPHILLCVGIDGDEVLLSDSEFESIQRLPISHLRNAWNSEYGFGPLDNRWLVVQIPSVETDRTTAAETAVEHTVTMMLAPGDGDWDTGGIAAIRRFATDLPNWTELEDTSWCARFAYQNIERRGTGGGAFRRLYAEFLNEVAEDVDLPADVANRLHDIADDWTQLSTTLKDASESDGTEQERLLDDASTQANAIADREEQLFTQLRKR